MRKFPIYRYAHQHADEPHSHMDGDRPHNHIDMKKT